MTIKFVIIINEGFDTMKKAKHLILELVILIAITASLVGVYFVYKGLNEIKPTDSSTNEIKNYSTDKYIVIRKDLSELEIYEIPEFDKIVANNSKYYFLTKKERN